MHSPDTSNPKSLKLYIREGHICSFKNSKMLSRGRLITDPTKQKKMERYTRAIESQLRSLYQTAGGETGTGLSLRSWIALSVPLDDSIQWVPEITIKAHPVSKGQEGANITIEALPS